MSEKLFSFRDLIIESDGEKISNITRFEVEHKKGGITLTFSTLETIDHFKYGTSITAKLGDIQIFKGKVYQSSVSDEWPSRDILECEVTALEI